MKKSLLSLFAIIMIATTIKAQIPTKGLVAYYPFSGNANDSSGNGNNGTVNGATLTTDRFGNPNSAYSFNGTSNYIVVPDNNTLDITNHFTLSAWINIADYSVETTNDPVSTIFGKPRQSGWATGYALDAFSNPVHKSDASFLGSIGLTEKSVTPLNQWVHILCTYDSISLKFYINGILDTAYKTNFSLPNYSTPLYIGTQFIPTSTTWNRFFKGVADDIRIYNRALDSTEVSSIYHEGGYDLPKTTIPTNGLVAWYPFTGNANDSSGNGNNGNVNGATLTTDRFGKTNSAYSFDGSSNYIFVNPITTLSTTKSPIVSFAYWINVGSNSTSNTDIFDLRSTNNSDVENWINSPNSNNFGIINYNAPNSNGQYWLSNQSIQTSKWVFVVTEINFTNSSAVIYLNNNKVGTTILSPGSLGQLTSPKFNIGSRFDAFGSRCCYYNGTIDDIRVYNRALDSTEVQALYHEGGYDTIKTSIPKNGLIAWYPFTGNALDSSGNGNNGIVNGATLTTDRFGKANSAYSFDGISNIIQLNDSVCNHDTMSISLWYYSKRQYSALSSCLIGYRDSALNLPLITQYPRMELYTGPTYTIGGEFAFSINGQISVGDNPIINNQGCNCNDSLNWTHVVLSYLNTNANASIFSYRNGQLYNSMANLNEETLELGKGLTCIGGLFNKNNSSLINLFKGKIDDIRIYNRALDSTEVQALYYEGGYNGTLPLTITKISAINNGGKVAISWATANELNTNLFAIQHSVDGINFTTINTINAKGSGTNGYSCIDNTPTNGINYYRLESIDKDGSISYSKLVSVQLSLINSQLSIFPNPAKDRATISFGKLIDKATIAVYDITGKAIITQQINNSTSTYQLNTQKLTKGIYIVKFITGTSSINGKLVIER